MLTINKISTLVNQFKSELEIEDFAGLLSESQLDIIITELEDYENELQGLLDDPFWGDGKYTNTKELDGIEYETGPEEDYVINQLSKTRTILNYLYDVER